MEIREKTPSDPVAALYIVEAYMRWALLAIEEVIGKQGMAVVLRDAGLEHLIDNYPPDETRISDSLTFGDYANLSAELLAFFGRAGKGMLRRIGRLSAQHGIRQQSGLFGLATVLSAKVLPVPVQLKVGLGHMQSGFTKLNQAAGQEVKLRLDDLGDRFAYVDQHCWQCAGKAAGEPICLIRAGTLQAALHWLTGKEFPVHETSCRATGAPACVWEIDKTPRSD
jgi:predicted hydrocarbon binding protein